MKRYTSDEIQMIRELRGKGLTYSEIYTRVGYIPKSSLTYICNNVELPKKYGEKIQKLNMEHLSKARQKALITNRAKMESRFAEARKSAAVVTQQAISINTLKLSLAMLYLGEGAKWSSRRGLALGSSSVLILQTYIALLEKCYAKERNDMKARIQYRADQNIMDLTDYWSKALKFSSNQFYKTAPDMRTAGKPTMKSNYHGVCVVTCSGADIQLELAAIASEFATKLGGYSSVD